ncbi:hypothetical protein QQ054_32135 [Oscillatoria amoena NRMC-F 0135]|nr:hypothetical protein [Oscillatoria amoena NRMC-F 0135]
MTKQSNVAAVAATQSKETEPVNSKLSVIKNDKPVTVEDRFEKARSFNSLVEKYNKIKETKITLTHFKVSADKHTSSLQLADEEGNTFFTRNPSLLAKVLHLCTLEVEEQMAIAETEALGFAV